MTLSLLLCTAALATTCSNQPSPWPEGGAVLPGDASVMVWHQESPDPLFGEPILRLDGQDFEAEVSEVVEGDVHVVRVAPVNSPVSGELELWWSQSWGEQSRHLDTYTLTEDTHPEPPSRAPRLTDLVHDYPNLVVGDHHARLTLDDGEELPAGYWEVEFVDPAGETWTASTRWATGSIGDVMCARTMPGLPYGPYEIRAREVHLSSGAGPWSEWQRTKSASGCSTVPRGAATWGLLMLLFVRRRRYR